jgi:hypothetical protein
MAVRGRRQVKPGTGHVAPSFSIRLQLGLAADPSVSASLRAWSKGERLLIF